jgi:hypothetical protein
MNLAISQLPIYQILVVQEPHDPAGYEQASHGHGKAVRAVADHLIGGAALRDAKHNREKEREQRRRAEVRELKGQNHGFFPIAM